MTIISVDVEADGPCPGLFSMVSLGAVVVRPGLEETFYATMKPLEGAGWKPEALAVSGFTREQTLGFESAEVGMQSFADWVLKNSSSRPIFISDNNGFDWQFVNYYFHLFEITNPFGHSSMNLGSLYKGIQKDCFQSFKHLRDTPHTHNALDDAKGNAEVVLKLKGEYGLKIRL